MDGFADLLGLVKANALAVLTLIGSIVTGILTYRATNRKTAVEEGKLGLEGATAARKIRVEEGDISFKREAAINDRVDRLVSHLQTQLEAQNKLAQDAEKRAIEERRELREIITGQTTQIGFLTRKVDELKARVSQLITFIREDGREPPPPPPAEDK